LDVTLTHPKPYGPGIEADIEAAEKRKYDRYLNNFELSKSQVIPLVFTFMGGWSKQTEEFMRLIFMKMAQGKEEVFNKMYTRFRYQVSMVIVYAKSPWERCWSNYVPVEMIQVWTTCLLRCRQKRRIRLITITARGG
jgi:hypothetical protein